MDRPGSVLKLEPVPSIRSWQPCSGNIATSAPLLPKLCWSLATGSWFLVTCYWLLATRCKAHSAWRKACRPVIRRFLKILTLCALPCAPCAFNPQSLSPPPIISKSPIPARHREPQADSGEAGGRNPNPPENRRAKSQSEIPNPKSQIPYRKTLTPSKNH